MGSGSCCHLSYKRIFAILWDNCLCSDSRIAFSDPTASVGSEINVKKITSSDNLSTADIMLAYDANSLEFIEGTNAEGGNRAVRVHGDGGAGNTTTLAYDLKFKASAAGTSKDHGYKARRSMILLQDRNS